MIIKKWGGSFIAIGLLMQSCSMQKQIQQQANHYLLKDSALSSAHIGIAVQKVEDKKWLYTLSI